MSSTIRMLTRTRKTPHRDSHREELLSGVIPVRT